MQSNPLCIIDIYELLYHANDKTAAKPRFRSRISSLQISYTCGVLKAFKQDSFGCVRHGNSEFAIRPPLGQPAHTYSTRLTTWLNARWSVRVSDSATLCRSQPRPGPTACSPLWTDSATLGGATMCLSQYYLNELLCGSRPITHRQSWPV